MWAKRSNTIQPPLGERSTDIQVPSLAVKAISRVWPRGWVTSQAGFSGATWARAADGAASRNAAARVDGDIRVRAGITDPREGYTVPNPPPCRARVLPPHRRAAG